MKSIYDDLSLSCSKSVTSAYSTSFSSSVKMLGNSIQPAIHSIYGFVRLADEIVDTFHGYEKEYLLEKFEQDFHDSLKHKISLNPILNSFQKTIRQYNIDLDLVTAFLDSMKMDLNKKEYENQKDYEKYIYGSADVVGLMCLKVFVDGDEEQYEKLKPSAMRLGSAFQKVNFLRDLKSDLEILDRSYFPNVDLKNIDQETKEEIIKEIEEDFRVAREGILMLPKVAKFGVYTAYIFYSQLLKKLKRTPSNKLMSVRIRVNDTIKFILLVKSYFSVKLKVV